MDDSSRKKRRKIFLNRLRLLLPIFLQKRIQKISNSENWMFNFSKIVWLRWRTSSMKTHFQNFHAEHPILNYYQESEKISKDEVDNLLVKLVVTNLLLYPIVDSKEFIEKHKIFKTLHFDLRSPLLPAMSHCTSRSSKLWSQMDTTSQHKTLRIVKIFKH